MKLLKNCLCLMTVMALVCGFALAQEIAEDSASYVPGVYSAKAKGYGGYVVSEVTIDENGKIASVKLTGDNETPYVGGYALEEMPAWIVEAQSTQVDAYSGATFTHDAVIAATQEALDLAGGSSAVQYKPGVYSGKAKGYGGYVVSEVTIDENGKIANVKLTGDNETPYVGGYALEEMPAWIVEAQSTQVDAYSGATFTHDAVIEATQTALDEAGK